MTKLYDAVLRDVRCTCEIKCSIALAKAAFSKKKKKTVFTSKLDFSLRKNFKCAGAGWRRSVGSIVSKMTKCYVDSRRTGISYIQ
jgi:hypothetical protein